jgi:cysteine desulfurase
MSAYLDYNATTPVDPRVIAALQPWLGLRFGNASSRDHAWGWDAEQAMEEARARVAGLVSAVPSEIIFTSGATESLSMAIKAFVGFREWKQKKIVACAVEHAAVLAPCLHLQSLTGIDVEILKVDNEGHIDLDELRSAASSDKQVLVALMAVNNEIGTIYPVQEMVSIAHAAGAKFLCDMTQAVGKMAIDVREANFDYAAFSAHKMYGPKGVGALYVRRGDARSGLEPLIVGGGEEQGLRGGTQNVPGIVGFGEACQILTLGADSEWQRVAGLRNHLEQSILSQVADTWVNGDRAQRICNTTNIGFAGLEARALIRDMHDIAVSTRAACSSGAPGPSHVLKAIGLTDHRAYSCIRISLGRFTTRDEIEYVINKIVASVQKLKGQ